MLFNYIFSLISVFIIIFVVSDIKSLYEDIKKEIHYIRKDMECFIDEDIQSIITKKKK